MCVKNDGLALYCAVCRYDATPTSTAFLSTLCRIFEMQQAQLMSTGIKSPSSGLAVTTYQTVRDTVSS
jgi:hypothetical protein